MSGPSVGGCRKALSRVRVLKVVWSFEDDAVVGAKGSKDMLYDDVGVVRIDYLVGRQLFLRLRTLSHGYPTTTCMQSV
jgi:hypothetical protein